MVGLCFYSDRTLINNIELLRAFLSVVSFHEDLSDSCASVACILVKPHVLCNLRFCRPCADVPSAAEVRISAEVRTTNGIAILYKLKLLIFILTLENCIPPKIYEIVATDRQRQ